MDPPKNINFISANSLLVINPHGKLKQIFVPFTVKVITPTTILLFGSWVVVEEIKIHNIHKLLYRVTGHWRPYNIFLITIKF